MKSITSRRWFWPTVAILVAAGGYAGYRAYAEKAAPQQFRTGKIEKGPMTAAVSATGTIQPVTSVQVGSQISGQVKELLVDFNTEVKKNQLIARIDPEQFEYRARQSQADVDASRASVLTAQANISAARAQLAQAEVNAAEAQRDYQRKKSLVDRNFISPAEAERALATANAQAEAVKTARAQLAVSEAQAKNTEAIVKQREAQLAQAKIDLERTAIKSPVDGIVIKRSVDVGQTVAASLSAPELFVIAKDLRDMEVQASIDEADVSNIRIGQKTTFTVDALPNRTFEGTVKQVRKAAQVVQNVVTYTVVISADNSQLSLLPGMTANVRVITATRDAVLKVPNAALRYRPPGEPAPTQQAAAPAAASGAPASAQGGQPAGQGGPGGQMRQQRDRLVAELKLDAGQTEKLDGIYSDMRGKFMGLRDLPEEERRRASERNRAEIREKIAAILTPEQKKKYETLVAEQAANRGQGGGRGKIYVLAENGKPEGKDVRLGLTDGTSTEVIAEGLAEGALVIVGNAVAAQSTQTQRPATGPRMF